VSVALVRAAGGWKEWDMARETEVATAAAMQEAAAVVMAAVAELAAEAMPKEAIGGARAGGASSRLVCEFRREQRCGCGRHRSGRACL